MCVCMWKGLVTLRNLTETSLTVVNRRHRLKATKWRNCWIFYCVATIVWCRAFVTYYESHSSHTSWGFSAETVSSTLHLAIICLSQRTTFSQLVTCVGAQCVHCRLFFVIVNMFTDHFGCSGIYGVIGLLCACACTDNRFWIKWPLWVS